MIDLSAFDSTAKFQPEAPLLEQLTATAALSAADRERIS